MSQKRNIKRLKCSVCGKEISTTTMNSHLRAHGLDIPKKEKKENKYALNHDGLICQFCGVEKPNRNSLCNHERLCKDNPKKQINPITGTTCNIPVDKRTWNKGLTKETDERVMHNAISISNHYENCEGTFKGKHHTQEFKDRQRQNALENNYEEHFGSRKSYEYNDCIFISSYEVEVAKDLDANNIKWIQPKKDLRLPYIDNTGKKHHYIADFYLPEYNIYLDPKNDYLIENDNPVMGYSDKQKIEWVMEQNNVKVIILNKDELTWQKIKEKL